MRVCLHTLYIQCYCLRLKHSLAHAYTYLHIHAHRARDRQLVSTQARASSWLGVSFDGLYCYFFTATLGRTKRSSAPAHVHPPAPNKRVKFILTGRGVHRQLSYSVKLWSHLSSLSLFLSYPKVVWQVRIVWSSFLGDELPLWLIPGWLCFFLPAWGSWGNLISLGFSVSRVW